MRDSSTEVIIKSLRILARDIQSDDGVANLALLEAADCLERVARERDEAREKLNTNCEEISNKLVVAMRKRAEARNKMADALQEVDLRTLDFERMKEERDDALSQIYQAECRAERFCQERDVALFLLKSAQAALDAIHSEVGGWVKNHGLK